MAVLVVAGTLPGQAQVPKRGGVSEIVKQAPQPETTAAVTITDVVVDTVGARTRLRLTAVGSPAAIKSALQAATVSTATSPTRVVLDLPAAFELPPGALRFAQPDLGAARTREISLGRSQFTIETIAPMQPSLELATVSESDTEGVINLWLAPFAPDLAAALPLATPAKKARPMIVIDPGHGGADPGAVNGTVYEKDVVLGVARALQAMLAQSGRYDVQLTRSGDVFVSLAGRVARSRSAEADLFISIHADSFTEAGLARGVRGATVYVQSDVASHSAAQALADKENAADLLGGVASADDDGGEVRNILFDLMKRETQSFAQDFRTSLISTLKRSIAMAKDPERSAAFRVLRQAKSPAVLVELGYISNADDVRLLNSAEWQANVANAMAQAIDGYFQRHPLRP